jgi:hypothetical protein
MRNHRTGTMARRGAHARDTGSTTGVATAVLALLSAGTLASFGLVTAGELRAGGHRSLATPHGDVLPPADVVVTPAAPEPEPGPGSGGGEEPVGPFDLVAVTGGTDGGTGPSLATSGPGDTAPPTSAPVPEPVPETPVFASVDPVPSPGPSVLSTKHGRALGHLRAPGRSDRDRDRARDRDRPAATLAAAATPTSLTFLGTAPARRGHRADPARRAGQPAARQDAGRQPDRQDAGQQPGRQQPGPEHGRHPRPTYLVLPLTTAPALPAVPGNGHGHAYGHDGA